MSPELDSKMDQIFNEMLERVSMKSPKFADAEDRSLGIALDNVINYDFDAESRGMLDWYYANLEYACATDLKNLSNKYWDQDDVFDFQGEHLMLTEGYIAMFDPIAKDLDIELNTEVNKIVYDENGADVFTSDGKKYHGDAVLVTVPLGVLKDDWIKFEPPLPEDKRESIKKLGYGLLNKIALHFEDAFWDTNVDWIGTINVEENRDLRGHVYLFWNMQKFTNQPILVALCAGEASHILEERNKEEVIEEVLLILQRIYKLDKPPVPKSSVITAWKKDKYARGSYSYVAIGSSASDYNKLAETVMNRVYFGGEATNRYHPATVAGAYQSGIREARKIHNFFYPPQPPTQPPSFSIAVQQEEKKRRANSKKYAKRGLKSKHRRGILRQRTSVLGSGDVNLKFKYEYIFNKAKQTDDAPRYQSYGSIVGSTDFKEKFSRHNDKFNRDVKGYRSDRNQRRQFSRDSENKNDRRLSSSSNMDNKNEWDVSKRRKSNENEWNNNWEMTKTSLSETSLTTTNDDGDDYFTDVLAKQEENVSNNDDEIRRKFRDWVAAIVVKKLSKYKSKIEDFKKQSRKYTHKIVEKEIISGKWDMSDKKKKKIIKYLKSEIKRKYY